MIIEPRDYQHGRFLIVGEKGSIGNYPTSESDHYWIRVVSEGSRLLVSAISEGGDKSLEHKEGGHELATLEYRIDTDLLDMEQMDVFKILGLVQIFEQETKSQKASTYHPLEAIYDKLIIDLMIRLGRIYDFNFFGTSMLKRGIKLLGFVK